VAEECVRARPPLRAIGGGAHRSACARIGAIAGELRASIAATRAPATPAPRPPTGEHPIVTVDGVSKRFESAEAVKDVSLRIERGESVGLVGQSGSGKTTLARCLVALQPPSVGRIVVDGTVIDAEQPLAKADRRRLQRTIQIVFQDPYSSLNPARRVGATLFDAVRRRAVRPDDEKAAVAELLERVGLPAHYASRRPVALSGGERQRVAIARALGVEPRIVVCDEPVSALDVSVQAQILNLLRELQQDLGLSYLFVSHDLAVVRQVADRVYVMRAGEIVEQGAVDQVLGSPRHEYTMELIGAVPGGTALQECVG
jgi:peptide/nickel transport system ATP-binding protein